MIIDRNEVVALLKSRREYDRAARAAIELPAEVDLDVHRDELTRFGINPLQLQAGKPAAEEK